MKTVVIYCTHLLRDELKFFLNHGYFQSDDVDFHICFNGDFNTALYQVRTRELGLTNLTFHRRENLGFDFGCWSDLLLDLNLYDKYDYFIFLNSSCYGPFLPTYVKQSWVDLFTSMLTEKIKLVGPTINYFHGQQHVQSYMLCMDKIGLQIGLEAGIFSKTQHSSKETVIHQCEIVYGQKIMNKGYQITCMLSGYRPLLETPQQFVYPYGSLMNWHEGDPVYPKGYLDMDIHPYEVIFFKSNRGITPEILQRYVAIHNYKIKDHDLALAILEGGLCPPNPPRGISSPP
jgi:hypothetical protein